MTKYLFNIVEKFEDGDNKIKVCIIGLGYVGLPLLINCAKSGCDATGIDIDARVITKLNFFKSHIDGIEDHEIKELNDNYLVGYSTDYAPVQEADVIIIAVPTPLSKDNITPDLLPIDMAVHNIIDEINAAPIKARLVILESTVYPGVTEENVSFPIHYYTKMIRGENLFVAFSPERVDPGNVSFNTKNTPKLVGGVDRQSSLLAEKFYSKIVDTVVRTSNARVAEFAKLYENSFRAVNIALANELMMLARAKGVPFEEVSESAATKPFGFTRFNPGPGVGGHCIPVDPLYLSYYSRLSKHSLPLIDTAMKINEKMPEYVLGIIKDHFATAKVSSLDVDVYILGMTYKPDISDLRESPSIELYYLLEENDFRVKYHDPYVNYIEGIGQSTPLTHNELKRSELVVLMVDHTKYVETCDFILKNAKCILDTKVMFDPGLDKIISL